MADVHRASSYPCYGSCSCHQLFPEIDDTKKEVEKCFISELTNLRNKGLNDLALINGENLVRGKNALERLFESARKNLGEVLTQNEDSAISREHPSLVSKRDKYIRMKRSGEKLKDEYRETMQSLVMRVGATLHNLGITSSFYKHRLCPRAQISLWHLYRSSHLTSICA